MSRQGRMRHAFRAPVLEFSTKPDPFGGPCVSCGMRWDYYRHPKTQLDGTYRAHLSTCGWARRFQRKRAALLNRGFLVLRPGDALRLNLDTIRKERQDEKRLKRAA